MQIGPPFHHAIINLLSRQWHLDTRVRDLMQHCAGCIYIYIYVRVYIINIKSSGGIKPGSWRPLQLPQRRFISFMVKKSRFESGRKRFESH